MTYNSGVRSRLLLHGLRLAALSLASISMSSGAWGATLVVDSVEDALVDDGNCTLREAVRAANLDVSVDACPAGSPPLDTVLLPAGLYALSLPGVDEDEALALEQSLKQRMEQLAAIDSEDSSSGV